MENNKNSQFSRNTITPSQYIYTYVHINARTSLNNILHSNYHSKSFYENVDSAVLRSELVSEQMQIFLIQNSQLKKQLSFFRNR